MIQVLGLRPFTSRDGKQRMREVFFDKGWRISTVQNLFTSMELNEVLGKIPVKEQWNLYYTVADCYEERVEGEKGRKLKEQWAIPFDIDGLHLEEGKEHQAAEQAARIAAEALGVAYDVLSVVFTGNGVQFLIHTTTPIVSEEYFEQSRAAYGVLARRVQQLLDERGVQGKVDVSVWSAARLLRLPSTTNRKPGKPERRAHLLNVGGKQIEYDLFEKSGVSVVQVPESISDEVLRLYPKPDTIAVCTGCKFLQACREKPSEVREPQWYAMLSITARLENGLNISHEYSAGHPQYSHYETELKIQQALASAGPRTCKNISSIWDGCETCEHYGKVTSPIMIKGEDYIASKDLGFREQTLRKDGSVGKGKPAYLDLIKYFNQQHPYKFVSDIGKVCRYNGKHWEFISDPEINAWVTQLVRPEPMVAEMKEFLGQLKAHNVTNQEELYKQREGFLNFQNCVLNLNTGETTPHSPSYGFFDVRPFNYDPHAKCPMWDKFVKDITEDEGLEKILKEFGGYCISGDRMWMHKALFLKGTGRNGKSVFMETLGQVVGKSNYSAVPMQDLKKDTLKYMLVNKLFNYSEEASVNSLSDSELFKTLTGGGAMTVKELYVQPYTVENKAKIIVSSNHELFSNDNTNGMLDRVVIVPLHKRYVPGVEGYDPDLKYKMWESELPGICNSLMEAYKNLKARGALPTSERAAYALKEFQVHSDNVLLFVQDCVESDDAASCKSSELYEEYVRMCEMRGLRPINYIIFGKRITLHTGKVSEVLKINNVSQRMYKGLKINKEY